MLLGLSTVLDYLYGFGVASTNKRKAKFFLWLSIFNNLGILGIFKYYNFFVSQFSSLLSSVGLQTNPVLLSIALPVGISFYTFHGMSYVFDIYRGKQKPVKNIVDYALFVSFFPLLVAGPIERANHLLPQIQRSRNFNYENVVNGCRLILWGMFKKIVIADSLAMVVNPIFEDYNNLSGTTLLLGSIAFSFQIYSDFSGYSDIALGTAKLFGFELLSNFKFPYFSRNLPEFWKRWHISLSTWFRDYLYIPLGGSKEGLFKAVRNTFVIFIVSGFWHGASWNFIIWGFIHACGFMPFLLYSKKTDFSIVVASESSLPTFKDLMKMILTFSYVTLAWIFFRLKNLDDALNYLSRIFLDIFNNPTQLFKLPNGIISIVFIVPLILIDWYLRRDERILKVTSNRILRYLIYLVFAVTSFTGLFKGTIESSFIYFQF